MEDQQYLDAVRTVRQQQAPVTLDDYRRIYESARRRALLATRWVEIGASTPNARRTWSEDGRRLALKVAHDLYYLSVKIGTIAWNYGRVGNAPRELRREIEATHAELIAATRPLAAIERALGLPLAAPSPDDVLGGYHANRRGPHHGPSGV